ncbi:MAG: hypothetical protein IMY71_08085 [Bacteroidetes bacterium]|nr:hypothetical protein [Bacteroidota bacterium]
MKTEEVKNRYERQLLRMPNVVGVMSGYKIRGGEKKDELSVVCLVEKKLAKDALMKKELIPGTIQNVSTDVIQVGRLRAFSIDKKARHRPCPMGTSGGHTQVTAGTNGELINDRSTGKVCIGTNNHVGANSNDADIGDPYLQPGVYDGGSYPDDVIGHLLRFVPIVFIDVPGGCGIARFFSCILNLSARIIGSKTRLQPINRALQYNLVDAAMIEVDPQDVKSEIVDIGIPKGTRQGQLDMVVQKSGRTTCHTTEGIITGIDATVGPVSYGPGKYAYFRDQIIISKEGFCAGGDSGSLVLDNEGYAVGKLFAGNETENITIANHIHHYLDLLDANLVIE